jgi:hypothetical protein
MEYFDPYKIFSLDDRVNNKNFDPLQFSSFDDRVISHKFAHAV